MVQPYHRAGIAFGNRQTPWDRMSERERQVAVMERVKKNIKQETAVQCTAWFSGSSVQIGCLGRTSANNGHELAQPIQYVRLNGWVCCERSVWDPLKVLTPSLASKWTEDRMCKQEAVQWCPGKRKAYFIWLSCGFESREV